MATDKKKKDEFNPLLHDKSKDLSKLKAFADDIFILDKIVQILFEIL